MPAHDSGGSVVPLLPATLSPEARSTLRSHLAAELPRLEALLAAAREAADGPDPEAALVFLGMLSARSLGSLFPH